VDDQGYAGFGGPLTDNDSIAITINAVNDAPVLTVPGAQAVDEDTALVLSGASIADVDVSGSDLEVTLSVTDGTITLASTTGLTFSLGADGSTSMTFTGTLANINTAIASLTYQGTANFNGTDALNILVDDLGNTGSGGALIDNGSIAITVNPIDDAPTITNPGAQAVNEDIALPIAIAIDDVDATTLSV